MQTQSNPFLFALSISLCLFFINGCSQTEAATVTATSNPPTPTLAPTETSTPEPTLTPSPSPTAAVTATVTYQPPKIAQAPEDIAGVWFFRLKGQGGLITFDAAFTINIDGTYSIDDSSDGMHIERGTFTFNEGNLVLDSDECSHAVPTVHFFHCVGVYKVYSTFQGDVPVLLRFVVVDDPDGDDRALNLKDRTLKRVAP